MNRRVHPLPPSLLRVEFCELARSLSLDDLQTALQVFQLELDHRQGRMKYRLPEPVRLNS
jgi:hypothetical protein